MKKILTFLCLVSFVASGKAQGLGIGTSSPDKSAQLDVSSTSKGFLPPRLTTAQRDAIQNPADGLVIFNITDNSLQVNDSTGWRSLITPATFPVCLPAISIGSQEWMIKNLEVAFYRNGDPIPRVDDMNTWTTLTTGAWCFWNNDSVKGTRDGKLYNWYAVNDPRGLAPQGWHIPSEAEWIMLGNTLGGSSVAGNKMKTPSGVGWNEPYPYVGGNNSSGFTAQPGGVRYDDGTFDLYTSSVSWWSSTEDVNTKARGRFLFESYPELLNLIIDKRTGIFVRCVRD